MAKREEPYDLKISGRVYRRILWGEEGESYPVEDFDTCPDCGVAKGEPHVQHCDVERCPRCKAQLLSCNCDPIEDA